MSHAASQALPTDDPSTSSELAPPAAARADAPGRLHTDVADSVRNAVKLGSSLLATWAVALGVRILLPRVLGPAAFGTYQFADAFTTTVFIVMSLGVETYIRKEVATRSDHASDFFGGTLIVRVALGVLVTVVALWGLGVSGKSADVRRLVLVLGVTQLLFNLNSSYAALLQAKGEVDGLSVMNVAAKLAWGIGIGVALALHGGVFAVGVAMLISESLRTMALVALAGRHLRLRYTIHWRPTAAVLLASVPYYLMALFQTVYARIDVSIMSYVTSDVEVGWYGAASNIAGMSLLLAPLITWVLLPLTSRAAARSEEELTVVSRRSMELILCMAIPVSLFLYLAAGLIVHDVFGPAYEPARRSLEILAPLFVLTYAAMVSATMLIRLERGWAVTWISIAGGIASPLLNLWLIPRCAAAFGHGGAGIGAAITLIVTELGTTAAMTWLLGGRAFDGRSCGVLAKTCAACLVVIAADRLAAPLGAWRLVGDAALYVAIVVAWGALDLRGMVELLRGALARRAHPDLEAA
ncbi:MAG TPA: flippase [Gemmatimonadaceae bacterium]|nr:flippase [Gemmatimonadaceae bacterium]